MLGLGAPFAIHLRIFVDPSSRTMFFPLRGAMILGAVGAVDKKKVLERHIIQKQELKLYYHRI